VLDRSVSVMSVIKREEGLGNNGTRSALNCYRDRLSNPGTLCARDCMYRNWVSSLALAAAIWYSGT
jgi:hypothetical protein